MKTWKEEHKNMGGGSVLLNYTLSVHSVFHKTSSEFLLTHSPKTLLISWKLIHLFIWPLSSSHVNYDSNENHDDEEDSDDHAHDSSCVVIVVGGERGGGWAVSHRLWNEQNRDHGIGYWTTLRVLFCYNIQISYVVSENVALKIALIKYRKQTWTLWFHWTDEHKIQMLI